MPPPSWQVSGYPAARCNRRASMRVAALKKGAIMASCHSCKPMRGPSSCARMQERHGITSFAMELVPRISRAQSMDALSSQAVGAGYKAVLDRGQRARPISAHADHGRGHHPAGGGAGHRRGRRRPAGDRHRETLGRRGRSLRRAQPPPSDQVKSLGAKFIDTGVSAEGAGGYARELTAEEKAKIQQEMLDARIAVERCRHQHRVGAGTRGAASIISTAAVRAHESPVP